MKSILIKNGRIWDGETFFFGDVLVEEGRISRIAPNIENGADFVFDAAGMTVSAGLVDIHVHMQGISGDSIGISAEMSCFPFGVTAAADGGATQGDASLLNSFLVKNVVFPVARIVEDRLDEKTTEERLARYGSRAVGVKLYLDAGSKNISTGEALGQVCDFAGKRGLKVMVHCNGTPITMSQVIDTLRPGDVLTHIYHGGQNNAAEDGFDCLRKAKEKGVVLDAGFAAHVHTDMKIFADALAAGVYPDTISTDITCLSAYTRGGRYGLTMCMSMARTAGMAEEDIFRCVTSAPAKALGKENDWGCLQVGRKADIAVLDYTDEGFDLTDQAGNRLCSEAGYRCVLTVSDGQIIYKH